MTDKDIPITEPEDEFIVNPYRPNDFELGRWFYREDVIEAIKDTFKKQHENKLIFFHGSPGAGKTSTLKHIEKSRQALGKNYIPVYLAPRDYSRLDPDNLLLFIYGAICKKLKSLGYIIQELENIKEQLIKGQTAASFLLLDVDNHLNKDDVLVLIVDEFDHLFENADVKSISDFISFFLYIEKDWRNYALIIAGDKSPINLTVDDKINGFLQNAFQMEIDGFPDEKTVEKYNIEPLRDQITYDDDAVQAILWYSGRHSYFQQLICYYIVEKLIAEERNHCSKEDVERATQRILKDSEGKKRPEFSFTWEHKMSIEIRLIASALMDDSITEKKKDVYILEENKLLNTIFDQGINKEIKKFPGSSYFNQMENRKFSQFPIKIPLLGLWIEKEQPFIKTIIDHMAFIAEKVDMDTINAEIKRAPSNKLPPFGREAILKISKNWCLLEESITGTPRKLVKNHIELFREGLSELLNLGIIESESNGNNYFVMDIKNLNIGILEEAFCFIQDRPGINEIDISNIENIATSVARDSKTQLTLYFYLYKSGLVQELVKKTYLDLIPIDSIDLKKIVFSKMPRDTIRNMILSNLTLQKVSPYQITGPTKATFYGRTDIINQISRTADSSYAIVGARKIGKTSLLYKIVDNPPPNNYYIFMNLDPKFKGASTYKPFFKGLEEKIAEAFHQKVNLVSLTTRQSFSRLTRVIHELSMKGNRIIFVFDEVDAFIKFDSRFEYRLLHTFRTLSQDNYCQFIFAGFKTLYHRKREMENPLYNFTREIMLKPLEREAALDLITKPMESIGVHYQDEKDRELILEYTARHPNLLQFICEKLIAIIEKHANAEDRRTIYRSDIQSLFNHAYEEYIMDEIYMFYSDLTNLDRLILVLLVEEQSKQTEEVTLSLAKIRNKLIEQTIEVHVDKIYRVLRNLLMRFILLDKENDNYGFALPVFPCILEKRIDNDLKKTLIEETKKEIKIDSESI